jgi:hypothetical protein
LEFSIQNTLFLLNSPGCGKGSWFGLSNASSRSFFYFLFSHHFPHIQDTVITLPPWHPNLFPRSLTSHSHLSSPTIYDLCLWTSHVKSESGSKNSKSFPAYPFDLQF